MAKQFCFDVVFDFKINKVNKIMAKLGRFGRTRTKSVLLKLMDTFAIIFGREFEKNKKNGLCQDFYVNPDKETGKFSLVVIDQSKEKLNSLRKSMIAEFSGERESQINKIMKIGLKQLSIDPPEITELREFK